MENFTNIINKFVNKMGYKNNDNLEGIVFYGSRQTGFANKFSDIDLHILFNNNLNEEIRGSTTIDGIRIEYFEKKLSSMYKKAIKEFKNQANSLVSIIEHGTILYDKNGRIKQLQNYISQLYSLPLPCMEEEKAKEQLAIIYNFIDDLKNLIETNNLYKTHIYHLTLERIKDFYFSYYGLAGVSRTKTLKIMQNIDYCNAIKKNKPNDAFIKFYMNCLNENLSLEQRFIILQDFLEFVTKDIIFNKKENRIILTKNKSFN